MKKTPLAEFLELVTEHFHQRTLMKLTLGGKRDPDQDLKNIFIKMTELKKGIQLTFLYRFPTKDITKHFDLNPGLKILEQSLTDEFYQGDLYATEEKIHLLQNSKGGCKIQRKKREIATQVNLEHDRPKKRFVQTERNLYLRELGILDPEDKIKKNMQDKYKQIDKFVDIMDGILRQAHLPQDFHVVDMGAGKGYLTFALADYLRQNFSGAQIQGIELRPELVEQSNLLAQACEFEHLQFIAGKIEDQKIDQIDVLIALHACDTATDDALWRGIQSKARCLICAPCCHKQIRKQLQPNNELQLIAKHGILEERQAEILTDSIRAAVLEAYGYKTKVFEFISTEHTPKNVLIVATLDADLQEPYSEPHPIQFAEIQKLKALFGIKQHYLEQLLGI